jgi:hypothetical protein
MTKILIWFKNLFLETWTTDAITQVPHRYDSTSPDGNWIYYWVSTPHCVFLVKVSSMEQKIFLLANKQFKNMV